MTEETPNRSVTIAMSERFGMMPQAFEQVLRATVVPPASSKEQFVAFLLVAKQYGLNPLLKEIYAYPAKGGGIQPIVGIDGWMRMINDHLQFDGMEFVDHVVGDKLESISCKIFRKDRSHPVSVTEYMSECKRDSEPWKKWPARMLRHKAAIQAARYAFGFSGIIDPDEYERDARLASLVPPTPPPTEAGTPVVHKSPPRARTTPRSAESKPYVEQGEKDQVTSTEMITDADAYLDDLKGQMAVCKTADDLAEVWQEHVTLQDGLTLADRSRADDILEFHRTRVEKAA